MKLLAGLALVSGCVGGEQAAPTAPPALRVMQEPFWVLSSSDDGAPFYTIVAGVGRFDRWFDGPQFVAIHTTDGRRSAGIYGVQRFFSSGVLIDERVSGSHLTSAPEGDASWGTAVAGLGDLDGDGDTELVISSPGGSGFIEVHRGTNWAPSWGEVDGVVTIPGPGPGTRFGEALAAVGDVFGDGRRWLLVGAPQTASGTGAAWLIPDDALLGGEPTMLEVPNTPPPGVSSANNRFGEVLLGAGDLNGDGYDDFLVGVREGRRVDVFLGGPDPAVALVPAFSLHRPDIDSFGWSLAVGELNEPADAATRFPDLVVGAPRHDGFRGGAFVFYGTSAGPALVHGAEVPGLAGQGRVGAQVLVPGDVNGDGQDDLLVVASGAAVGNVGGEVRLFYGRPGGVVATPDAVLLRPGAELIGAASAAPGDLDGDGLADAIVGTSDLKLLVLLGDQDVDRDGFAAGQGSGQDCDDADPAINPVAAEVCDGVDNDCDGLVDDDDPGLDLTTAATWFRDADGDGYGTAPATLACERPAGHVANDVDCDDTDAAIHPFASEVCDGRDNDCDGRVDDLDPDVDPSTFSTWYADTDGDGFGDLAAPRRSCAPGGSEVADATDCDDANPEVNPDATEVCNGVDDNCDGLVDDADPGLDLATATTWFADGDGDGYGDADVSVIACAQPEGSVADATDCDDAAAARNPGADEQCGSGVDEDCDGLTDWDDDDCDVADYLPHRCGCASTPGSVPALVWLAALLPWRRRRAA